MTEYGTNTTSGDYDRKNRFLLLVDSDANNLYYMSMILQRLDYRVTTAENAEEAVAIATVADPFLFIVSLELPGSGGIELIQQLKIGGSYQVRGMGVGFCRISPKDQELIRLYIRDEVTRGIMPLND